MNLLRRKSQRKSQPESDWPFDDPPNVAVITTRQITSGSQPILYVSHEEEDGSWQFHTGGTMILEDAKVVSLHSIVSRDNSIKQLADLPLGWIASRGSATAPWQRVKG